MLLDGVDGDHAEALPVAVHCTRGTSRSRWQLTGVLAAVCCDVDCEGLDVQLPFCLGENLEQKWVKMLLIGIEAFRGWPLVASIASQIWWLDGGDGTWGTTGEAAWESFPEPHDLFVPLRTGLVISTVDGADGPELTCVYNWEPLESGFATAIEEPALAAATAKPRARRATPPKAPGGTEDPMARLLAELQGLRNEIQAESTARRALEARMSAGSAGGITPRPAAQGAQAAAPSGAAGDALQRARDLAKALPGAAQPEGAPRQGPQRQSDVALEEAVARGGEEAAHALQFATLEVLQSLRGRKKQSSGEEDLDELLFGGGEGEDGSDPALRIHGTRGAAGVVKLNRAIEKEPRRWSDHTDKLAQRIIDPSDSGLGWSMDLYGRQQIYFGKLTDHQRMWTMLSALHALDRRREHDLLGAKLRQCLKAVEQSVNSGGRWEIGWLFTGLPDPRPTRKPSQGLAHPAEYAVAISRVRENQTLESAIASTEKAESWWAWQPKTGSKGDKTKGGKDKGKGKDKDKGKGAGQGAEAWPDE